MIRKMMTGAGTYIQGEGALELCGQELKRQGRQKAFLIGGQKALYAAYPRLAAGLDTAGIIHETKRFSGYCTAREIDAFSQQAVDSLCDCVIGIGGGKVLDLAKAVAAQIHMPVYTVPTCAATCAAYASLSIIYNEEGCQVATRYHLDEVSGVFVDTRVLAEAPPKYLAAGMADAMAKSCEYSSMRKELRFRDADISKYLGYAMAKESDRVLMTCGAQAYRDNQAGIVSEDLEDALFCTIAATGIISGMGGFPGRTGSRFAIAHGFNEVMRGRYVSTTEWLHGEIVALGILAQIRANGLEERQIQEVREFYHQIGVPTTLKDMGVNLDDVGFAVFQQEILEHSHIAVEYADKVKMAVASIRG